MFRLGVSHYRPRTARIYNMRICVQSDSLHTQLHSVRALPHSLRTQPPSCNVTSCLRTVPQTAPMLESVCTVQQKRRFHNSQYLYKRKTRNSSKRTMGAGKDTNKWMPQTPRNNLNESSGDTTRHTMNPTAYALHTMGVELNGSCPNCEDVGSLTKDKKGSKFTCTECGVTCEYSDIDLGYTMEDIASLDVPLPRPRELVRMLDDHVIGQRQAKKVMSVAVYNHYKRVRRPILYDSTNSPQLRVGPPVYKVGDREYINPAHPSQQQSGTEQPVWKAQPVVNSATKTGHTEHTHMDIRNSEVQTDRTQQRKGTLCIDTHTHDTAHTHSQEERLHSTRQRADQGSGEIEMTSGNKTDDRSDVSSDGTRKVSSEGTTGDKSANGADNSADGTKEQTLAERLLIDAEMRRNMPDLEKANVMMYGPTGTGKTLIAKTIAEALDVPFVVFDCTTLTQAGYAGEDVQAVIAGLLKNAEYNVSAAEQGIVFLDEIDKLCRRPDVRRDVSGEGVQHGLLKLLEGTKVDITEKRRGPAGGGAKEVTYTIDTANILFVGSGAFTELDDVVKRRVAPTTIGFGATTVDTANLTKHVQQTDLIQCGLIPEFVGRFQVNVGLEILSQADLKRVMCEPKNAILEQYHALMKMDKTDLYVTDKALDEIAKECLEKKVNARGLRSILERVLLDSMYEAPDEAVVAVVVDDAAVRGDRQPALVYRTLEKPEGAIAQEKPSLSRRDSDQDKVAENLVAEV